MQIAVRLVEHGEVGLRRKIVEEIEQCQSGNAYAVFESESESEMYLFDPYKKCIQSNNETILDQGTPIKTSLVANIRATYYIIKKIISKAKNT